MESIILLSLTAVHPAILTLALKSDHLYNNNKHSIIIYAKVRK